MRSAHLAHNDPWGERDFGAIDLNGDKFFWRIDHYAAANCTWGSEDPSDPKQTYRVLTVMPLAGRRSVQSAEKHAEEY